MMPAPPSVEDAVRVFRLPRQRGKRVLALDGGGVRGLVEIQVLRELEARTGRRIHELFDLVVGTSTGGILALALALYPQTHNLDTVEALYRSLSQEVFGSKTGAGVVGGRYNTAKLEELLTQAFGATTRLSDFDPHAEGSGRSECTCVHHEHAAPMGPGAACIGPSGFLRAGGGKQWTRAVAARNRTGSQPLSHASEPGTADSNKREPLPEPRLMPAQDPGREKDNLERPMESLGLACGPAMETGTSASFCRRSPVPHVAVVSAYAADGEFRPDVLPTPYVFRTYDLCRPNRAGGSSAGKESATNPTRHSGPSSSSSSPPVASRSNPPSPGSHAPPVGPSHNPAPSGSGREAAHHSSLAQLSDPWGLGPDYESDEAGPEDSVVTRVKARWASFSGTNDCRVVEAARATSAAPTYFDPLIMPDGRTFVDGGLGTNNPAVVALREASVLWPDEDVSILVSLGTGLWGSQDEDRIGTSAPGAALPTGADDGFRGGHSGAGTALSADVTGPITDVGGAVRIALSNSSVGRFFGVEKTNWIWRWVSEALVTNSAGIHVQAAFMIDELRRRNDRLKAGSACASSACACVADARIAGAGTPGVGALSGGAGAGAGALSASAGADYDSRPRRPSLSSCGKSSGVEPGRGASECREGCASVRCRLGCRGCQHKLPDCPSDTRCRPGLSASRTIASHRPTPRPTYVRINPRLRRCIALDASSPDDLTELVTSTRECLVADPQVRSALHKACSILEQVVGV